jgi:hypothetical protein
MIKDVFPSLLVLFSQFSTLKNKMKDTIAGVTMPLPAGDRLQIGSGK